MEALPTDLQWRELRRADEAVMSDVPGGSGLPLREPQAVLALDERTLLVADRCVIANASEPFGSARRCKTSAHRREFIHRMWLRRWIDEENGQETGAVWRIDLSTLQLAGDLQREAERCFRT